MPVDSDIELSAPSQVEGEISAEQRRDIAAAMVDNLMRDRGMTRSEAAAYLAGHLDSKTSGNEVDPSVLEEAFTQVHADTMSDEVVNTEFTAMTDPLEVEVGGADKPALPAESETIQDPNHDSLDSGEESQPINPLAPVASAETDDSEVSPEQEAEEAWTDDSEVGSDTPPQFREYVVNGIQDAENYANSRAENTQEVRTDDSTVSSTEVQSETQDSDEDYDEILHRTAAPSGKSTVSTQQQENIYDLHEQVELQQAQEMEADAQTAIVDTTNQPSDMVEQADSDEETPLQRTNNPSGIDDNAEPQLSDADVPPNSPTDVDGGGDGGGGNGEPTNLDENSLGYDRVNRDRDQKVYAEVYAAARIGEELEQGGFFKKMVKRAFKGNILRQYYTQKYKLAYDKLVVESGGSLHAPLLELYGTDHEDAIRMSNEAASALMERVLDEDPRMQEFLREGEHRVPISGNPEVDNQLRAALKDLSFRYARGELTDETILEERDRLFGEIEGLNGELFGKGVGFSDNIIELARNVRTMVEHDEGLDRAAAALDAMELRGAYARGAAESELRRTTMDKISEKLGTSRIGGTAIATGIILAGAVVFCGTQKGAQAGISKALRMTVIGAGASGLIAGANEYATMRREIAQVRNEAEEGLVHDNSGNKRRQRLEEAAVYRSESMIEATTRLRDFLDTEGAFRPDITGEGLVAAQTEVAKLRALIKQSDEQQVGLLAASGAGMGPAERLALVESIIAVDVALEAKLAQGGTITLNNADGVPTEFEIGAVLESAKASATEAVSLDITSNVAAVDKATRYEVARRVATAAVIGTAVGATWGLAISESMAAVNPGVTGLFETQQPGVPNTLANSLAFGEYNGAPGSQSATEQVANQVTHTVQVGNTNSVMNLPQGFELQPSGQNAYNIVDTSSGKTVVDNLTTGKYGGLTAEAKEMLTAKNLDFHQTSELVAGGTKTVNSGEFYQANKAHLIHSSNSLMMNDTVNNPDYNELHFYASGKDGSWFDSRGNVRIRVDGISPDGSFMGNYHPNPVEAIQNGQLKVFMSIDKAHGLDNFAFKVVEHNGHYQVVIPKTSPAIQLFGDRQGGGYASEGFLGRYLGTAIDKGPNASGTHQFDVINSVAGNPKHHFEVPTFEKAYAINLDIPTAGGTVIPPTPGETLPVFGPPIYPRRGIGAPLRHPERPTPDPEPEYGGGGYYETQERQREWEEDRSPRLRDNPDATLNPREELLWYRDRMRQRNGNEYVDELESQVASIPELQNLPKTTKAIVCIPVAAANESENIYNTLSLYAQQEGVAPGEVTMLLHVNWMDEALNDPQKLAAIEKTRAEIARAKSDFPDLRIAVLETQWEKAFMDTQRGVIGHVARKMMDVAALASAHAQDIGQFEADQDVLVVRNDSDAKGMSRRYLEHMLGAFDSDSSADAFVGGMRWETESHKKYPGFGVSGNFREVMQALTGRPGSKDQVPTIGINHAIRVSMLAAIGGLGTGEYTGAGSDDLEIQGRVYAARGTRSNGTSGYSGYGSGSGPARSHVKPIKYVVGAQIDSSADRVMAAYFGKGRGFIDAWNDFDAGGYKEPDMSDIPDAPESPEKDIDTIASRIERDISGMSTQWFRDPARVRTGLAFMFPDATKAGQPIYEITWNSGRCSFRFTPEGKTWLKKRLMRDSRGRYDSFGTRAARALYGKVESGASKRPRARVAPMVAPPTAI